MVGSRTAGRVMYPRDKGCNQTSSPSETFETLGYKSYLFSAQNEGYIVAWPFLRNRNRIISSMEWESRKYDE